MNRSQCMSTTLAVILAQACGKPQPAVKYPVSELTGDLQCWMGATSIENAATLAFKTGPKKSRTLMRQAWDSAASTLHRDTVVWPPDAALQRGTSDIKIDGQAGKITGANGGTATFDGAPGKWTRWIEEAPLGSGMVVKTKYEVKADNSLAYAVLLLDGKGEPMSNTVGTLTALDAKRCHDEFEKIPPAP